MRSIPFRQNSTAIRSLKGSVAVATLTAALLSSGLQAADTYDGATGQVTAPVVRVGDDYYRDVVITVGSIVSIGEAAEGDAKYDTFNGATGQLTIPAITDGTIFAYNVVVTLGALISQGGKCESLADCLGEVEAPEVVPVASDHAIFYGAAPFAEWVETSYSADSLTLTTNLATPARVMISDAPTLVSDANYLSIGDALTNFSGYSAQALGIDSDSTYRTYYSKLLRLEAETSDSSCYRLRSHLHPNFALDVDEDDFDNLKFRNNFGNTATSYGYVCFTYDKSARLLRAKTRYNYSAADFTYTQDSSFARGNYYVKLGNGGYSLVASSSEATKLYIYDSPLDFSVPFDFNPAKTTPVTNPAAAYISKPADFNISRLGSEYTAQVKVDGVAAPGTNATTRTAADAMLLKIQNSLASGESLRYDIKVYAAFRDGLLASTLQSDGISNGELGQNLVPYVFFTNEKDSNGVSHPYMVIMSYGNPASPHGLMDVPRPPGQGSGSYGSSNVTRFTNLDRYSIGIPMKDYGEVSAVDENASVLSNQLWDDVSGSKGARDVFNYASANDNGIMISGAVMFPVYNNRLMPSQADAELSANGCHVGQGGGGPHCHADGYESQGVLGVY
ncbi:MAG: hypothetical protein HOJ37_00460, partial [Gammaproteobacteria bacterium]|nr:hypothetical protein [Gammaproteobacteria bacterium]